MRTFILILTTLFLFSSASGVANRNVLNLTGISGVEVYVEYDVDIKNIISETAIKDKIEVILRADGITVKPNSSELVKHPNVIMTHSIDGFFSGGLYVYTVSTDIYSYVVDKNYIGRVVALWSVGSFGTVGQSKISQLASDYEELLYAFINDWQQANNK